MFAGDMNPCKGARLVAEFDSSITLVLRLMLPFCLYLASY
jgi:hypothetical protein